MGFREAYLSTDIFSGLYCTFFVVVGGRELVAKLCISHYDPCSRLLVICFILVGVLLPLPHTLTVSPFPLAHVTPLTGRPLSENYRVEERYEDHLIIKLVLVSVHHQLEVFNFQFAHAFPTQSLV